MASTDRVQPEWSPLYHGYRTRSARYVRSSVIAARRLTLRQLWSFPTTTRKNLLVFDSLQRTKENESHPSLQAKAIPGAKLHATNVLVATKLMTASAGVASVYTVRIRPCPLPTTLQRTDDHHFTYRRFSRLRSLSSGTRWKPGGPSGFEKRRWPAWPYCSLVAQFCKPNLHVPRCFSGLRRGCSP